VIFWPLASALGLKQKDAVFFSAFYFFFKLKALAKGQKST